ncbi:MAG: hypothetical protein A3B31_03815 [Candidatus Komeilibacteria bacterium RIFCSPLOWO2_01_FULL_53_11]|uniref:Uncharacterized protein n=1 Tax=Candidatus Komeilibacteria bacterium RIFCSPLOWO2_01_FULL_53_11 TaxID=1798552 RepID=A0A1G2BT25_9BACT|nr:MAG: hypothetical protein A3B31_03815 [Candidatus Komeilibacteria bacterium RIFCSPLOWO2_01_FULL_53_11]
MIAEFLNVDLVTALGLDKLPQDQKDQLIAQMTQVVDERLQSRIIALLSEVDTKALDAVLAGGSGVESFLRERIPSIDMVVAEVIAEFKQEMLDMKAGFGYNGGS